MRTSSEEHADNAAVRETRADAHIGNVMMSDSPRSLVDSFDVLLSSASESAEPTKLHTEVLVRTSRIKVTTIRAAAHAYGVPFVPSSRSGAVRALVSYWTQIRSQGVSP